MSGLVYLAGPITGEDYAGATDWREYVSAHLSSDLRAISPMRGKSYLASETSIADSYENLFSNPKAITTRDRNDVMRCDLVLANLLFAERVSIGTTMEIAWADAFRKPVILVAEQGGLHHHAMLTTVAGWVVADLRDATDLVNFVLGVA